MWQDSRIVVQVERLSDQVYQLIREDLKMGDFTPGERLFEVELAEKYKVSRTPVREALVQLFREGLLDSTDRGFAAPTYSRADIKSQLEVKRLLDQRVAEHVAVDVEPAQIKALIKAHTRAKAAHNAGKIRMFKSIGQEIRTIYHAMCKSELLIRCLGLVDDQFEIARSRLPDIAANRIFALEHGARMIAAISARDAKAIAAEMETFHNFLEDYCSEHMHFKAE